MTELGMTNKRASTVGTLTPSYADVVWSTDGSVVSQQNQ